MLGIGGFIMTDGETTVLVLSNGGILNMGFVPTKVPNPPQDLRHQADIIDLLVFLAPPFVLNLMAGQTHEGENPIIFCIYSLSQPAALRLPLMEPFWV